MCGEVVQVQQQHTCANDSCSPNWRTITSAAPNLPLPANVCHHGRSEACKLVAYYLALQQHKPPPAHRRPLMWDQHLLHSINTAHKLSGGRWTGMAAACEAYVGAKLAGGLQAHPLRCSDLAWGALGMATAVLLLGTLAAAAKALPVVGAWHQQVCGSLVRLCAIQQGWKRIQAHAATSRWICRALHYYKTKQLMWPNVLAVMLWALVLDKCVQSSTWPYCWLLLPAGCATAAWVVWHSGCPSVWQARGRACEAVASHCRTGGSNSNRHDNAACVGCRPGEPRCSHGRYGCVDDVERLHPPTRR